VLRRLPRPTDANLLVGFETSDDAGVYLVAPGIALVQTVDFFTPIVDDPFTFGQIAAANSLSDVYAMGGRPLSALSVVGFPANGDPDILEQILRGGLEKMTEAGCTIVGGHSVKDEELKFGYAVTGLIHPQRIWRNVGARPGDALLLTKPLGTGLISTALKNGAAREEWVAAAVASMTRLNRDAAEALASISPEDDAGPVHAVTDVTGFGLLGHAREMAAGSGCSMELAASAAELLPGAAEAARAGQVAGGLKNNRQWLEDCVEFADTVSEELRLIFYDPQTSGGLLVAVAEDAADRALAALAARGVASRHIGRVVPKRSPMLHVLP
jgi:selenide, water dikinase